MFAVVEECILQSRYTTKEESIQKKMAVRLAYH